MSSVVQVDLFAEDRGHEQLLPRLIQRLADEEECVCRVRVVSARGGHPRVAKELETYQKVVEKTGQLPDLLVVGIDANCQGFRKAKKQYEGALSDELRSIAVIAAPDPHIERWYIADDVRFEQIVGARPRLPARKCDREHYKVALERAVLKGGHTPTLHGLEFGPEIAQEINFYHAGKKDGAFRNFIGELRTKLRSVNIGG